jgi:hypothetical protein
VHSNVVDHAYYNPLWQTLLPHDKTSSTLIFPKQATLKFRVFSKSVMKNLEWCGAFQESAQTLASLKTT